MKSKKLNNAILLISDITKGMKSVGSKALLNIHSNLSILEYQIQFLRKHYSQINIYLCTGFDNEKMLKIASRYKNIYFSYNEDYDKENQVGSLIRCIKKYSLKDSALIINNGLIPIEKIEIDKNVCSIGVTNRTIKIPFEIGININSDPMYLFYGFSTKWTEYLHLNTESLQYIYDQLSQKPKNYPQMFLFELINSLSDSGIKIELKQNDINPPIKVNNIKDITIAKKYYEKHLHNKIKQKIK